MSRYTTIRSDLKLISQIIRNKTNIFARHPTSTILLLAYYLWYVICMSLFNSSKPDTCVPGAGMAGVSMLLVFIYTLILLILILIRKNQRKDFLKFLILVYLPVGIIIGFLLSVNLL